MRILKFEHPILTLSPNKAKTEFRVDNEEGLLSLCKTVYFLGVCEGKRIEKGRQTKAYNKVCERFGI